MDITTNNEIEQTLLNENEEFESELNESTENENVSEENDAEDADSSEPKADAPKISADAKGTYHGIFLAPLNQKQRITDVLTEMAKTDEELAKAIAEGKKTFDGCDRYIRNNMADLMREMKAKEITFCDADIHLLARYYMVNADCQDTKNVANEIAKAKTKEQKSKEQKPKTEKKPKKSKVLPLTETMGDLFKDMDLCDDEDL